MSKSTKIAALGLAAGIALLPVAGAFADDAATDVKSVTEQVEVTVQSSCTFNSTGAVGGTAMNTAYNYAPVTIANGAYKNTEDVGGGNWTTTYNVYCNDNGGWEVFAVGSSTPKAKSTSGESAVNAMTPASLAGEEAIATGTATSGDTANWAMKVTKDAGAAASVSIINSFNAYSTVPATETKVVKSTASTTTAGASTFATGYQVYIGNTTKADTYTGKVTYRLAHPATAES